LDELECIGKSKLIFNFRIVVPESCRVFFKTLDAKKASGVLMADFMIFR